MDGSLRRVPTRHDDAERCPYEQLAQGLLDALDPPTCAVDDQGVIVAVNRAWGELEALPTTPVDVGRSYFALCEAAMAGDAAAMMRLITGLREVLAGDQERFELDYACLLPGETRQLHVQVKALPGMTGAVVLHNDVTEQQRAEQDLEHRVLHDELTDLPNRELLTTVLTEAIATSAAAGLSVGVAFLDIDQFRRVNDSLGHLAGDELLVAVTERLGTMLRRRDTLARFAGDQFVAVWPDIAGPEEATSLAEQLREAFSHPFAVATANVTLSASIGVTVGAAPQRPDELLFAADTAMRDAKHRGSGLLRVFSAALRSGTDTGLQIESELRAGLQGNQFAVHYQPVVDLRAGRVTGVEALVRWNHPDGQRMPDSFIPVAESCGLIVELGSWVLHEACRQAVEWERAGLVLDLAVNFSARQMSDPAIVEAVIDALAVSGLPPERLMLEVTESTVLEDAEDAQAAISRIAELGATIAIDDFGTGYSSLLYLRRYPVRALKVDRSFVAGMSPGNDDHAIVTSVVSLARAVGSSCVAEGIETQEQHAALQAMGCDYAQGYLYSRPVPAPELPAAVQAAGQLLQASQPASAQTATSSESTTIEQFVVDRIRQLHQSGASLHTIAAALNREHAPHPHASRWHSATVAQVIAGSYRPSPRRRSAPAQAAPARAVPTQPHRELIYDDDGLVTGLGSAWFSGLGAQEAVLLFATAQERTWIEAEMVRRGLDLDALALASQYRAWDVDEVLRQLTIDGHLSRRLFRHVIGNRLQTTHSRFGRVRVYSGLSGVLWGRGDSAGALSLESAWAALAGQLSVDVVCGIARTTYEGTAGAIEREQFHAAHQSGAALAAGSASR